MTFVHPKGNPQAKPCPGSGRAPAAATTGVRTTAVCSVCGAETYRAGHLIARHPAANEPGGLHDCERKIAAAAGGRG
jgi:hypothetical protein